MTPVLRIFAVMAALLPQQPASTDPAVQLRVAVYRYNADGSVRGSAGGTVGESPDSASLTWVASSSTSCGMCAGALPPRQDAVVWKSSGRIVSHSGDAHDRTRSQPRIDRHDERAASESEDGRDRRARATRPGAASASGPCGGRTARLGGERGAGAPPSADAARVGGRADPAAASAALGAASRPDPAVRSSVVRTAPRSYRRDRLRTCWPSCFPWMSPR